MAITSMTRSFRAGLAGCVGVGCLLLPCGGAASGDWEQTHKLTADDAAANDYFGISVSVSGDTVIVGAYGDDDAGEHSGSAYVFDAVTGEQLHKLTADDAAAAAWFGYSVSVSGSTVVVGAPNDDDGGSAYVFDATTGQQLHKLTADDASPSDFLGLSVSISGSVIVVGAPYDNDAGIYSGSAYVFDATTGQQAHKLTADDGAADDYFGFSVFVSGNTIVVGADGDDEAGSESGSAYVFDANTGEQLHKLTADDATGGERFGWSVHMSGNIVVVGSPYDDVARGSAYVFDATTGEQLHKLTAGDADWVDRFGISVSVSGDTVVAGADGDDDAGYDSGSAYVFDAATGEQLHKLTADDGAAGDLFGHSVSVSGNMIVVGAYADQDVAWSSGSAYVFQKPVSCPADFDGDGDVDTADLLFLLGAWGTPDGDVDGDGDTDTADLLALLGAWGECP